jgi:hypothetical protein
MAPTHLPPDPVRHESQISRQTWVQNPRKQRSADRVKLLRELKELVLRVLQSAPEKTICHRLQSAVRIIINRDKTKGINK